MSYGQKVKSPKVPPMFRGREMTDEDCDICASAAGASGSLTNWESAISWIRAFGEKAQELGYALKGGVWVKERKGFALRF